MGNVVRETSIAYGDDDDLTITNSRYDDAGNMVAQAIDIGGNGRAGVPARTTTTRADGSATVRLRSRA